MRKLYTDKWEIHLDEFGGKIKFYRRQIVLGEIVCSQQPKFVLEKKDFRHYLSQLKELVAYLETWKG